MLDGRGWRRSRSLVWRVKLVAVSEAGVTSEAEVARIERDDVAILETIGLTLDKANG